MYATLSASPVSQRERITLLDSIRGMAILGILLMNIPLFGMAPWLSYDLRLRDETGTVHEYIFWFVEGLMSGTQRALFSMLFGAGVLLFLQRQQSMLQGLAPADYFFRRQMWLMVISIFDVYILLWAGDILFDYALYGMLLFVFRDWSPRTLLIAATVCMVLNIVHNTIDLRRERTTIFEGEAIAQVDTTRFKLTAEQQEKLSAFNEMKKRADVKEKLKRIEEMNADARGDYSTVYKWRTDQYVDNIIGYMYFEAWDVFMFMFAGMAFYKLGIITGEASTAVYLWFTLIGVGLGLVLTWFRLSKLYDANFDYVALLKSGPFNLYQLERALRSIGILGLIMLLYKSGWFGWWFEMFRPVGQMALTNYLMQSLLCGLYFHGYGLGMYGHLERLQLYYVVAVIWVFQIIFSHVWMRFFVYGPCEWLWRSLTYWNAQPFRRRAAVFADL